MTDTLSNLCATMERWRAEEAVHLAANRAELLRALRSAGAAELVADYDGCGDSGNVEGLHLLPEGVTPAPATEARLADFAWAFVSHHHPGFENNEGAFGQLRWDMGEDAIALDHGERVTEVSYLYDEGL